MSHYLNIENNIVMRPSTKEDHHAVTPFIIEASGGLCGFIFNSEPMARKMISLEFCSGSSAISFRNCVVVQQNERVIAAVVFFPSECLQFPKYPFLSEEKLRYLKKYYGLNEVSNQIVPLDRSLFIHTVCVDPQSRKLGLGKKLLDVVIQEAQKNGFSKISLYVWEGNKNAINFYLNFGFKIGERIPLLKPPLLSEEDVRILMYYSL